MDMVGYKINQSTRTRSGETIIDSLNSELFSSTSYASGPRYFGKKEAPKIYNAFSDTQSLMKSNESKIIPIGKKIATTALMLYMAACGGGSKPKDLVNISSAISAHEYPNGIGLQGNSEYAGFGSTSFGQRMELGKIEKGTSKAVTANLTASGYLPSTLLLTLDGDYIFNVDMLRNGEFNIQDFINYFRRGDNPRWDVDKMKLIYNPNRTTGDRLSSDYTSVINNSAYEMQSDSGNFFTVSVDENGNKPDDTTVPPDGEIWVYHVTDLNGISNATYPIGGDKVKSAKIFINPNDVPAIAGWHEFKDACYQEEQNRNVDETSNETLRTWYKFTFKREAGGGYSLTTTREVRPQSVLMDPGVSYSFSQSVPSVGLFSTPEDDYGYVSNTDTPKPRNVDKGQHGHDREIERREKK
jgi:hypothetical protein